MKKKVWLSLLPAKIAILFAVIGIASNHANTRIDAENSPTAICEGIANDVNNNIAETTAQGNPVPRFRTLLKYDVDLGTAANEKNVVSTTGQGITLNGVPLSEITNALVDYANGSKYIRIKIPQDYQNALKGDVILEVHEGTVFENKILDGVKFALRGGKWSKLNYATYEDIQWNNEGYNYYASMSGVLLRYNRNLSKVQSEIDGGIQSTNFASTAGEHIYLGGFKVSSLADAFVSYHSQGFIFIYAKDMVSYRTLEIEDGTPFLDAALSSVKLYFNISTKWTTTIKTYDDVVFSDIQWNNEGYNYYVDKKGVLLKYNKNLSQKQTEIDGGIQYIDFSSTVGESILLGNKKLSTLEGAMVSYHSQGFIFIYADNMPSYRILKITAGTIFMDSSLPELTLYYTTTSKWSLEPEPATPVSFTTIYWNNTGHDVYEGKKGLMLSYSTNLSNAPSEISGGVKNINYVDTDIGESIKLDGTAIKTIKNAEIKYFGSTLLWIYVPKMDTYNKLTIESVTFMTSVLPETYFGFFDSEWAEIFKITNIINGEEKIDYQKKNSGAILNKDYFDNLFEEDVDLKLISFQVGSKVYYPSDEVEVNNDVTVTVTAIGFETTRGASIRMNELSSMRFESKITKAHYDDLVSKYGIANVELGTYIIPQESLGVSSIENYFKDIAKEEGVDYEKIVCKNFVNEASAATDGYYRYVATSQKIAMNDFNVEYCGVGYLKINDGTSVTTLYGLDNLDVFSRSVIDVIESAYGNYPVGGFEKAELTKLLNSILAIKSTSQGLKIDNIVDGYLSPYKLNYNAEKDEYIVTGEAEIKSVLINGEKKVESANIMKISGKTYKFSSFNVETSKNSSTVKFKLAPVKEASELVDFAIEMPEEREMRILQLTDTQIIDSSQMRKPDRLGPTAIDLWQRGNSDKNCFNHITELIEKQNPDLIVFTGDIVYGEFDDSGEIWLRMIEFLDSFNIPWAPVFGNHDNETKKGVDWQCEQFVNAKNCLFKQGELTGNGNYSIGLTDSNGRIRRVIYMMDSNGCLIGSGFGQDQIDWMTNTAKAIDTEYGLNVPAFACYHIASKDFDVAAEKKYGYSTTDMFNLDTAGSYGDFGQKNEKCCIFGTELSSYLKKANVNGVFVGHDHVNNFSIEYDGIRYTYGTKTGIYDYYRGNMLGGTLITLNQDGAFNVQHKYLNETKMNNRVSSLNTFTVFTDLHHDTKDYGGFYCTKARTKLKKIVSETQGSKFYVNLGDTVNSCVDNLNNYYEMMSTFRELNLNPYNSTGSDYVSGNRMIYNLLGNHEVAYLYKNLFKDYTPYVEDVGNASVFKRDGLMFVMVDAIYTRTGSDNPSDIITCTEFGIPNKEIEWLKTEVQNKMDDDVEGIVWLSHVALKDIDDNSKGKLLNALKEYNLPMTVFEGHTHQEAYSELVDEKTGKVYCQVYTLPAVTLYNGYPYYNVSFKNGKVWGLNKRTSGEIA